MRYVDACKHGSWHLRLENPADGEERVMPYKCRSWRHTGNCCLWKGAQDFTRVQHAVLSRTDWVFIVLTFDQKHWLDWKEQYRLGCPLWSKVRHRLEYRYGKLAYIQTWERHKRKGIHANVLVGNAGIHAEVKANVRDWKAFVLEPIAVACGFGFVTSAKIYKEGTHGRMSGYLVKVARELVGANQKGQIPFDAPSHFRRLRASRGLLPPIAKSGWTGELVLSPIDNALRENIEDD